MKPLISTPILANVPSGFGEKSYGNVSMNNEYFYIKYQGWRRFPLCPTSNISFNFPSPHKNGDIYEDGGYFYVVINYTWLRLPSLVINPDLPIGKESSVINIENMRMTTFPQTSDNYGAWGMISFNNEYFCIWGQKKWHKIPITPIPTIL